MRSITKNLKKHTLTTRNNSPSIPQPSKRNPPLLGVNTANAINEDVNAVAALEEIERRLRHADVRLDPDDYHVEGRRIWRREQLLDLWGYHREEGLVYVGADVWAVEVLLEFWYGVAEFGAVLSCYEHGDLEG